MDTNNNAINVKPQMAVETKVCKQCGKELPVTYFGKYASGIRTICKNCVEHNKAKGRSERFKDVTNRELIEELKLRGYKGELRLEVITKEVL